MSTDQVGRTGAGSGGDAGLERDRREVFDVGLLSPVTTGHDRAVGDAAVCAALVAAELALVRAWGDAGAAESDVVQAIQRTDFRVTASDLAALAPGGGNPVIPLVRIMREQLPDDLRSWLHRGATSQDMLDTALMLVARAASREALGRLRHIDTRLTGLATEHRTTMTVARTLTQHAVPMTWGVRFAKWAHGVRRAIVRLEAASDALPAQLAGAGGTLAAFAQLGGDRAAAQLPGLLAAQLGLATPEYPWHTVRWPVTELGDALVQSLDALGVIATDVATLSRTEISEVSESAPGGSSAMPHKQNPAGSVLIRSAALRAPGLASILHTAAALAGDERPDGAWHAEWPTLRELLRLVLGAGATAESLVAGLQINHEAAARNLARTNGLIMAERIGLALEPMIGPDRVGEMLERVRAGEPISELLDALPEVTAADIDTGKLLDPALAIGLSQQIVDRLAEGHRDVTVPEFTLTEPRGPEGRPLVVLAHSLGTGPLLWEKVVPALAAEYRVSLMTLPGHGSTPVPRQPFTLAELADAVAQEIHRRGERGVLFAGVSIGGALGLELALAHSELVAGAAIIASAAHLGSAEHWSARAAQVRERSTSSLIEGSAKVWFAPESFVREPELLGGILHVLQETPDEGYARCAEALGTYDVRSRLPEIRVPIAAVWGEFDTIGTEQKQREIASQVQHGQTVQIAGAAHQPPAEQPGATARALLTFFAEVTK